MAQFLPPASGIVTFLTDFGIQDPYVGVMKGAALRSYRDARIVDVTHAVPPQDLRTAAFFVGELIDRFPNGTVHTVVVDPGVGSERRPICLATAGVYFIGPDNGVFESLFGRDEVEIREIDVESLRLPEPSPTFHGRDVFAPIAGSLARGQFGFRALGQRISDPVRLENRGASVLLFADHFGNLITDQRASDHPDASSLRCGGQEFAIQRTYSDVAEGEALALVSSFGTFEIAVRGGSAAERFGLAPGQQVEILTA
ncbi:MAG: SAM-dependent chlorinase/fluorinase [Planctomycetota bacterium]